MNQHMVWISELRNELVKMRWHQLVYTTTQTAYLIEEIFVGEKQRNFKSQIFFPDENFPRRTTFPDD